MSNSSQPKNLYDTLSIDSANIDDILKDCIVDLSGTGANMNDITIMPSYTSNTSIGSIGTGTITITNSPTTYTIGPLSSSDTITLTGIDSYSAFNIPVEWVDCLPSFSRIQDMCEKYPGLKIAFDNFKLIYEMCKDDYDNPTPKK